MAQIELTIDDTNLPGLFTATGLLNANGLKGLVEQVLNQVLNLQVAQTLQAEPSQRTAERLALQPRVGGVLFMLAMGRVHGLS